MHSTKKHCAYGMFTKTNVCVCLHFICCILHKNGNTGKHILAKYILLIFFCKDHCVFFLHCKEYKYFLMKIIPTDNYNFTILLVHCFNNLY